MAVILLLVGRSQSFASLHLYWVWGLLVHPTPKNQSYFKESTINSYAWYFWTIPSKFACATFQNLQNTSHFMTLFSAHEDVVVGFVIFHIELSTPWLACFICSSLILQGSWSDHCNLIKKKKKKGTPPWDVKVGGHPKDSVSHGLWKEKWGGVPNFIKEHVYANFSKNSEPLSTCLVWKITSTPLPVVDRKTTSQNNFLSLFYKWKALAHVKSLLPSAKGAYLLLLCWVFIFYLYAPIKRA
jgi:hypothetical protein